MIATWRGVVLTESNTTVVFEGNHYFPADSLKRENSERDTNARQTPAETLAEIAAPPLEGAADEFSGVDHDAVLYPRK